MIWQGSRETDNASTKHEHGFVECATRFNNRTRVPTERHGAPLLGIQNQPRQPSVITDQIEW